MYIFTLCLVVWLIISIVPTCSIHKVPTITLCITQFTLDHVYCSFHFGSSTVKVPFGWNSTDFPQNLTLGYIEPRKTKCLSLVWSGWFESDWTFRPSAWKADTGGWWPTCSEIIRKFFQQKRYIFRYDLGTGQSRQESLRQLSPRITQSKTI